MNIFKRAISLWGTEAQVNQTQEECGELVAAINQWRRGRKTTEDLAEEIADVEIMCEQMRAVVGDELVNQVRASKLARLAQKIRTAELMLGEGDSAA